ncbi:MAG: AMP-binding protein [Haemophilus parainfluenzae]|nr:AMP-binding protein [Haemophilus parainfluenzae]
MTLMVMGKVPVNLNYTLSPEVMEKALKKANISQVITSEKFLDKLNAKGFDFSQVVADKALFMENLGKSITKANKVLSFLTAFLAPQWWIKLRYFAEVSLEDNATILFSSGSEGDPKGIELSHKNLLTNIKQIGELLNFHKDDVILNSLPIFHSFGLTVTTLLPLCEGIKMVSVADPTDGATVGKMCARHRVSILFGTSTFFRLYVRNKKFPNLLDPETLQEFTFNQAGTVGMPLPGTIIKIVDLESLQELPVGEDGLILIGGGQVMKGYLNAPEKTAEVIVEIDGVRYYKTGDKGHIDHNGFITIVDRYSRFAKIGGEMISLGSVEEKLSQVFDEETQFVAVAVSDDKKGESIVLLIKSAFSLDEINERIKGLNVPPIMLPSQVFLVDEIPMLGSGKVDFKGAKNLAMSLVK